MVRRVALALILAAAPMAARAVSEVVAPATQFNCDALTVSQKLSPEVSRDLGPTHSLKAAEAVLNRHKVPFTRSQGRMTMAGVPQKVLDQINTLPQGEPIVLPNGDGVAICVIRPSADSF